MANSLQIGDAPKPEVLPTPPINIVTSPTGGVMVDPSIVVPPVAEVKPVVAGERPTWLPAKFADAEAMATAYGELERKQSAPKAEPVKPVVVETPTGIDMAAVEKEWETTEGKLSDTTLASLKAKGISPEFVATFVRGQEAAAAAVTDSFTKIAGSADQLTAVLKWAQTSLTDGEKLAYNEAVAARNAPLATMLFESIASRYTATNGREPNLVTGGNVPNMSGVQTFESWAQVTAAMSDPRYKNDHAYRALVVKRLEGFNNN